VGLTRQEPTCQGVFEVASNMMGRQYALALAVLCASAAAQVCGDCNEDGLVNVVDALTGAQHSVGSFSLTGQAFANCDVNSSGSVDIVDALVIAQFSTGLPAVPSCGGSPSTGSCSTPLPITPGLPYSGTTVGAVDDSYPTCAIFSTAEDLVFLLTTLSTRTITIDLTNPSYGSAIYVQAVCGNEASELGCDDSGGAQQIILPSAPPGDYYIWVDGISSGEGTFTLLVTLS
jgi:hypothetical protein